MGDRCLSEDRKVNPRVYEISLGEDQSSVSLLDYGFPWSPSSVRRIVETKYEYNWDSFYHDEYKIVYFFNFESGGNWR